MILGIDEVGRGPWAGPLVVGAVILPQNCSIGGLTDSKKLSATKRQALNEQILKVACGYGLGWVYPEELDSIGLAAALRLATIRAVETITASYHQIIIDGTVNFLRDTAKGAYVTTLPKADALIPAVSAASIIAKVARDEYMAQQAIVYPGYGFEKHVGYGTALHRQALELCGLTPLHRRSFAPIARIAQQGMAPPQRSPAKNTAPPALSTKAQGDAAENLVAEHLKADGYRIAHRNWRSRFCEIDIVAAKNRMVYFVEVKYRSSNKYGGGVAAVDTKKQEHMRRAAEAYIARYKITTPWALRVATVDGDNAIKLFEVP